MSLLKPSLLKLDYIQGTDTTPQTYAQAALLRKIFGCQSPNYPVVGFVSLLKNQAMVLGLDPEPEKKEPRVGNYAHKMDLAAIILVGDSSNVDVFPNPEQKLLLLQAYRSILDSYIMAAIPITDEESQFLECHFKQSCMHTWQDLPHKHIYIGIVNKITAAGFIPYDFVNQEGKILLPKVLPNDIYDDSYNLGVLNSLDNPGLTNLADVLGIDALEYLRRYGCFPISALNCNKDTESVVRSANQIIAKIRKVNQYSLLTKLEPVKLEDILIGYAPTFHSADSTNGKTGFLREKVMLSILTCQADLYLQLNLNYFNDLVCNYSSIKRSGESRLRVDFLPLYVDDNSRRVKAWLLRSSHTGNHSRYYFYQVIPDELIKAVYAGISDLEANATNTDVKIAIERVVGEA